MTPAVGATFAGFRIEALAGRGGMGSVYRARDLRLGRLVALKVIASELATDDTFRARFAREARLAAAIDHPNVVPVFGAGEDDGCPWIAMRWVDGADLGELVASRGPLEPGLAAGLVAQAASALAAAHERGLVHRDVKPANLLVGRDGHVALGDFGLARDGDGSTALTSTGGVLGTPGYTAPERVEGALAGPAADVYALGCVLYTALTGHPPFERDGALATAWAHVHDPAPALEDALPAQLREVVASALSKLPGERPDAAELARETAALVGPGGAATGAALLVERVVAARGPASEPDDAASRAADAAPTEVQGDGRARPPRSAGAPTARLEGGRGGGPRQGRAALIGMAAVLLAIGTGVLALTVLGGEGESGGMDRERRAAAAPEPSPSAPAPADPVGDVVRCEGETCRQSGEPVPAPVEGAACDGGGAWVRLDGDGGTPLLACQPGEGAVAAAPSRALSLEGAQLDLAETLLDRRGVVHETTGGGVLGIVARENWTVCATAPEAGSLVAPGESVTLFVERSC